MSLFDGLIVQMVHVSLIPKRSEYEARFMLSQHDLNRQFIQRQCDREWSTHVWVELAYGGYFIVHLTHSSQWEAL